MFPDDVLAPREPYCLKFYYHMYGLHVNKLQVVKMTDPESKSPVLDVAWEAVKEKGDAWLEAHISVKLEANQMVSAEGGRWGVGVWG